MLNVLVQIVQPVKTFALTCSESSFLGFPTWYKYLSGQYVDQNIKGGKTTQICQPLLRGINDVWLVVAAIIEILLRVGALISIGFIIWGGIRLIVSQGDPGGVKAGRETIQNAVIGLVITVLATTLVNFVAGRF